MNRFTMIFTCFCVLSLTYSVNYLAFPKQTKCIGKHYFDMLSDRDTPHLSWFNQQKKLKEYKTALSLCESTSLRDSITYFKEKIHDTENILLFTKN